MKTHRNVMNRRNLIRPAAASAGASLVPKYVRALTPSGDLTGLSIAEAARMLRFRELTSSTLVKALLTRIDLVNPKLSAFITVMRDTGLAEAAVLDQEACRDTFAGPCRPYRWL